MEIVTVRKHARPAETQYEPVRFAADEKFDIMSMPLFSMTMEEVEVASKGMRPLIEILKEAQYECSL